MSKFTDFLTSGDNLVWAWRKARRLYRMADGVYDIAELAAFELNLERELRSIADDFQSHRYRLKPLVLMPQPKSAKKNGDSQLRQSFQIAVRDQVAWIALVNVIGPILDSKMPSWSYGHRLFKAAWFEDHGGRAVLEVGPYRHSSGHLYRRFKHSWPLFRRHVSLSARSMVNGLRDAEELDDAEKQALSFSERPAYLNEGYWPKGRGDKLYYASLDLEKFYPKVTKAAVLRGVAENFEGFDTETELSVLLERMLSFRIASKHSVFLNDPICQPETSPGSFGGIPTGLMVAGFLSNVAMLPLDSVTDRRVRESKRISHFRFVDDHVVLAYDFDDLVAWIRRYQRALSRLEIGPKISAEKYDPPQLAAIINRSGDAEDVAQVRISAEIDGRRPTRLMTKTLALVSELAGAGFEIMPEHARQQRLGELEWLLLANLPDDEIRSDTRAAFAAGRIAKLVPMSFNHSIELLDSHRKLAILKSRDRPDESAIIAATLLANRNRSIQARSDLKRLNHYFKLLLQAFYDHPEKPRLFIRTLDYCRTTGHRGTPLLLKWVMEQLNDERRKPLAGYLKPLAVQIIARHIVTAAFDISDQRLLARQRRAARSYLMSLTAHRTSSILHAMIAPNGDGFAELTARNSMIAAAACAATIVPRKKLRTKFRAFAEILEAPPIKSPSLEWELKTGSPIGVWSHWLDGLRPARDVRLGRIWRLTRTQHDPSNRLDFLSLRKGPRVLSRKGSSYLRDHARGIPVSDAGWLLDQQQSSFPLDLRELRGRSRVFRQLRFHIKELRERTGVVSLQLWVNKLKNLSPYDPRVGEWTALEIVRQLAKSVQVFPSGSLENLDELHPSNVIVPTVWLEPKPPGTFTLPYWTWESWRHVTRNDLPNVHVVKNRIQDFRRQGATDLSSDAEYLWLNRLRAIGLLLLGLCCRDFTLPSTWNIRGAERDVGHFVKTRLENTTISSRTQAIIEAALLPRSAETALIRFNPWMFFGTEERAAANDTATDPPLITDIQSLLSEIAEAQSILEARQISVLNHAARQLVPMNVYQLMNLAPAPLDEDGDE